MRVAVVLSLILLMGRATATPHFRGVDVVHLDVDGSSFDIRVRGNLAEAIRINLQYAPRLGALRARAGFAMATVSGCRVSGVLGDQAVMTGVLDCQDAAPLPIAPGYKCIDVVQWLQTSGSVAYPRYDCSHR